GYPLELRPTTTGQFRFGATPDSTIIIGVWGSRQRKIKAAYQFFLYTLLGSVFMLLAILLILLQTGTTDLQILLTTEFSERRQILLWIVAALSNILGIGGSILLMLSHGLVSSALFLCVGVLYNRHKTRLVRYYGGLVSTMPNFSTIFFFFTLANMSLPGTRSFIGEFLILVGAFQRNSLARAAYSLWLYNRVVSGNLKPDFLYKFSDLNGREVSIFLPFLVGGAT
ncbi:hypothetical protein ACJX0J_041728, partial [Zea mays]